MRLLIEPFAPVEKFDPDQPRDPAGSETGGQWTDDPSAGDEVADPDGNPLTLYHGTDEEGIDALDPAHSRTGLGSYVTPNRDFAATFGPNMISGRLRAKEVIDLMDYGPFVDRDALPEIGLQIGMDLPALETAYDSLANDSGSGDVFMFNLLEQSGFELDEGQVVRFEDWGEGSAEPAYVFGSSRQFAVDEPTRKRFAKFDPDQPRAPKGDPKGGQWVEGGGAVDEQGIPIPPEFMSDAELRALARSDDPDKKAKFAAEEERRRAWREATWEQRQSVWAARDAVTGSDRPPLPFADSPEPKFIRFGDIPEGERSTVWAAPNVFAMGEVGRQEDGTSVYRVAYNADRNLWQIDDSLLTDGGYASADELLAGQDEFYDEFVSGGHYYDAQNRSAGWVPPIYQLRPNEDRRPIYLVTGDEVGEGIDGEPVIRNVRTLGQITARDVLHEGYFDPAGDLDPSRNPAAFGLPVTKFSPDQPRAPKGTAEGGQWVDAGGVSAEQAKAAMEELKNPTATPDQEPFDYEKAEGEFEGMKTMRANLGPGILGQYRPLERPDTIFINSNTAFYSEYGTMEQAVETLHDRGQLSSPHPNHVVWHEQGHALAFRAAGIPGGVELIVANSMTMDRGIFFNDLTGEVSDLASTNASEFIAEVYAGQRAGRAFSPEVIEMRDYLLDTANGNGNLMLGEGGRGRLQRLLTANRIDHKVRGVRE